MLGAAVALGGLQAAFAAGGGVEATTEVNAFSGAFQTKVPIGVPGYRGIEPKLGLYYSSAGGNGTVGVGWSLGGVSVIERAAPGHGVPRYDGTDVYLLDGNDLIPSCTTFGGQYCTRVQSYQRITWAGGANPWYVYAKDGTKMTYTAVMSTALGVHRWVLSEVRDTKNNYVTYGSVCAGGDCYIKSITYNGAVIYFHYENRTDTQSYGVGGQSTCTKTCYQTCHDKYGSTFQCNPYTCGYPCGAGGMATMIYRLKTIDVCLKTPGVTTPCRYDGVADPRRVRAYKISYAYTGRNGQSQISAIRQYGTDAVLTDTDGNNSGTVTGGSALPAVSLTYNANPGNTFALQRWATQQGGYWTTQRWFTGDFNGDGKMDFAKAFNDSGYASFDVHLSTGTSFAHSRWLTQNGVFSDSQFWFVGDFNGDGKTDFLRYWNDNGKWTADVLTSTGSAFVNVRWATQQGDYVSNMKWFVGDFNGDGKTDVAKSFDGAGSGYISIDVHVSSGSSFTLVRWLTQTGVWLDDYKWVTGDFNGDGRTDLAKYFGEDGQWVADVYLSSGAAFGAARWTSQEGGYTDDQKWLTGDFNGDGKTDFVNIWNDNGNTSLDVHVSTGQAFSLQRWGTQQGGFDVAHKWFAGDINGDGLADLVNVWNQSSSATFDAHLSTGYGFGWTQWAVQSGGIWDAQQWYLEDFTGDGKLDMAKFWDDAGSWTADVHVSTGDAGGATLSTLSNGLGGVTTVSYVPSSNWTNTYLPVGMVFMTALSVTVNDGRGCTGADTSPCYGAVSVAATSYTYQGARWRPGKLTDPVREFLGFRKATTTIAPTGAYSETYYWQREGTIAKPEVIYKRKLGGGIMTFDKFTFSEDATPPYTSLVNAMWAYECNGDGQADANHNYVSGCRRIYKTFTWDTYANLTHEYQYGDYDLSGDEVTAVRSFVPNTSGYVVGLPVYEELRQGIGTAGTILQRTRFLYDGATVEATAPTEGKLTKKAEWNSQTGTYVEHGFGYDAYGNMTSVTDPLTRTSTKTYDATYHLLTLSTTNPAGHVAYSTWNEMINAPLTQTDVNGAVTTNAYDVFGRGTLTTTADNAQVKVEHLSYGTLGSQKVRVSQKLPSGTWVYDEDYFDGLGRKYKKVSSTGITQLTVYNATGTVKKQSLPYAAADTIRYDQMEYDDLGRTTKRTAPDGTIVSQAYGDGWASVTKPNGNITTSYYDAYTRLTKVREVISAVNKDTTFYYDLLGRRTKSVDAGGYQTVATYDSLGRVLQKSDPDLGLWSYLYDAAGRITKETDALAKSTSVGYDTLGRATRRTYHDGTYDSYTFDESTRGYSKGRLTTAVSASGVTTRAWYDVMGRRTRYEEVVDAVTYALVHAYDAMGRLSTATYPDNEVVTYGYGTSGTATGKLISVSGSVAGTLVSAIGYSSKGQVSSVTYGNGVTTTTGFDTYGERVSTLTIGSLATISYGYDTNGQVTSMTSPQLTLTKWGYTYDSIGRLTRAANTGDTTKTETFMYDAVGRMTKRSLNGVNSSYTYGSAAHVHAVTVAGANSYAYDANGNMTSGAGRTLTYDLEHRPASIVNGGSTTTFTYDAQGVRVKKVGPSGTVTYVGGVYEKRGTAVTKYYFAGGLRVAKRDANGNQFFHSDHLGSTRLVTNASGTEVHRYEYAAFGTVLTSTGTRPDSHRFTGQEADDETGLMFYQSRYYDPALGRFIQPDSLLPDANAPQQLDPYAYAINNPVNYVDPSGHAAAIAAIAVFLGVSEVAVCIGAIIIGTALTFTNNPFLQTIGMVLAGVGGAGLFGGPAWFGMTPESTAALVALAQSPISPLDPTIKKAIGWAYTVSGCLDNLRKMDAGEMPNGLAKGLDKMGAKTLAAKMNPTGGWLARTFGNGVALAVGEIGMTAASWVLAYVSSDWGIAGRYAVAFVARGIIMATQGTGGPLAVVGSTYDLAYMLKYPDGRVIDLSGGQGGAVMEFYYHTGFEMPYAFGRQHIRVYDQTSGKYYELGDGRAGAFGPGIGWGGWISTYKITVIMTPVQAQNFVGALEAGAQSGGSYMGYHRDSYYYISASLQAATGTSAADLHINPGLIHW